MNFYPRPPRGGRPDCEDKRVYLLDFYPRPPRGGRRRSVHGHQNDSEISIHALREEGDGPVPQGGPHHANFYPRPPRGGRLSVIRIGDIQFQFLSTPSARRATDALALNTVSSKFLSTPSARRATLPYNTSYQIGFISIHALREEGDR